MYCRCVWVVFDFLSKLFDFIVIVDGNFFLLLKVIFDKFGWVRLNGIMIKYMCSFLIESIVMSKIFIFLIVGFDILFLFCYWVLGMDCVWDVVEIEWVV